MDNIQYKIKNKKNIQRFLYSYFTLFIIIALSFLILLETIRFVEKKNKIRYNTGLTRNEINKLDRNINSKELELEQLNTKEGKERYFRETLPVAGSDEKVFILYNATSFAAQDLPVTEKSKFYEFKKKLNFFIDNYTNL
jgi:hypothetical protein